MGLPKGRFSIYRGTELNAASRMDFVYGTQGTSARPTHLVDTEWLCWGAVGSTQARFHVVDGQEEDGGWSCRMKIDDGPYNGYWLDSSDGYVRAVGSSNQRWRFLGSGDHYEWWQDERPVVITDTKPSGAGNGYHLRAQYRATPQMYTISRIDG
ncbi:hypothetical protein AB0K40_15750 [Nonomuraea bangladeshensis]|uniref:Uncharacterized protein n=1 Tax=Nonomuraea bangladeshensis TaxID=404385 RepID=A0ABV3H350_9ACTN